MKERMLKLLKETEKELKEAGKELKSLPKISGFLDEVFARKLMPAIDLDLVKSGNMLAMGHSGDSKILRVVFQDGSVYDYTNIPLRLFVKIGNSYSKVKTLKSEVINHGSLFPCICRLKL